MISRRSLCALILLALCGAAPADTVLGVRDAWVRQGPPGASVLAGYMSIENLSGQPQTVVGVRSEDFERVEIHRTELREGMARMVPQERLQVPAHGRLTLEPGGYHLMLMRSRRALKAGDAVPIVLETESGEEVLTEARVRGGADEHGHEHH